MRLGMFHPNDNPLDRGWVGRIEDDRMLHLAAQTLQSFFLVGGGSRVHAEYPLAEPAAGREADDDPAEIERIVRETTGAPPRAVRFLHTDEGLVVFLTLALEPTESLATAHATASRVEERIWVVVPGVAEVIVHTEP